MIKVYTDGASTGNPGISGAGIYIKSNNDTYEYAIPLGFMNNHEAEFHAVIKALEVCKQHFPGEILSFRTDAQVVVDMIEKSIPVNKQFHSLVDEINYEASFFSHFFIKWIPNKTNHHADRLAKKAIQIQRE